MQAPRLIPGQEPLYEALAIATGIVAHMQTSCDAYRLRQAWLHGTHLMGLIPVGVTTEGLQLLETFLHDLQWGQLTKNLQHPRGLEIEAHAGLCDHILQAYPAEQRESDQSLTVR